MLREVLTYPNPLLKRRAPISDVKDPALATVFQDLTDTLRQHPGCVGLAAPQIGESVRALVVDVSSSPRTREHHGLICIINPEVAEASQWKLGREGCLSFPDLVANVKRAHRLRLRGFGRGGEALELESVGFEAVALQHEVDHLDGVLFLDRVRSSRDVFTRTAQ